MILRRRLLCAAAVILIFCVIAVLLPEEEESGGSTDNAEPAEYTSAAAEDAGEEETAPVLDELQDQIRLLLADTDGSWSVYVKDLGTQEEASIDSQPVYAASLIKLFVMESCYAHMEEIIEYDTAYTHDEAESREKVQQVLADMIEISDNEAYNELVRMHSPDRSFTEGCLVIQEYIEEQGYEDTGIFHTLHPSDSESESVSDERNHTSVEDCAALLEKIYNGTCVSENASEEMLSLLTQQQVTTKIPSVLPAEVLTANKTGETDEEQHDAAVIMTPDTDYLLCVMSTELTDTSAAVEKIQEISSLVYDYMETPERE